MVLCAVLASRGSQPPDPSDRASSSTGDGTPSPARSGSDDEQGTAIEVTMLGTMSLESAKDYLTEAAHDATSVRNGVIAYKVLYRTVDAGGEPTQASGLLVLPDGDAIEMHPVIYGHGTTSYRRDVASSYDDDFTVSPGVAFASRGFAAIMPDYVGLGDGPGPHPYLHVPTETSASIDMLTAVHNHLATTGRVLDPDVFVAGFSQGAGAALGVGRALDRDGADEFRLAGLAAISGAYSLREHQLPAMVSGQVPAQVAVPYTAFILTSWNRLYGLYSTPEEVFNPPYAHEVDRLFSGDVPGEEMISALPASPDELLTDAGRALIAAPGSAMSDALDEADSVCKNWKPSVQLRLFFAANDEQAVSSNTAACADSFRAQGFTPEVVDLGAPDRYESLRLGTQVAGTDAAADWFLTLAD